MTVGTVRNLRRLSQFVFFTLFFWLILKTNFEVHFSGEGEITLPYPVSLFLQFDPLTALGTLLATWSLYKELLWSLVILIPTIFLGRFFCGWICPLGTLNHWISEITSERLTRKGKGKIDSNRYKRYQRIKYYIFLVFIAAALAGTLQIGLLDPLPLLARSIGTFVLPTFHSLALGVVGFVKSIGWPPLGNAAQAVYDVIAIVLLPFRQMHFNTIFSIGLFFTLILALNRLFTRFWCRGICPLGAMLGIFSRFAIFGLQKDESTCTKCNKCLEHCQGADNPDIESKWRQAECHLCLNCAASCPEGSLSFRFFPRMDKTEVVPASTQKVDITRRKVMLSLMGGIALYPFFRSGIDREAAPNPLAIRPPGSVIEDNFLERCIRCGQCMRVCPNNALHPTLSESGMEGIWTPILIPRIGYCEPTCTLCGEVCPTGAILPLTVKQKVGSKDDPPVRIGTAFFDRGRCLPWAMNTTCLVCEEWCPTAPKAIYLEEEQTVDRDGNPISIRRPHIDPNLCTGCGACEYACPVIDKPAVYVTNIGETRSPDNQILLQRNI
ncbi:MAG: 4Fe-4S binding protein [Candidatus Zixiibacteriota bacterium]